MALGGRITGVAQQHVGPSLGRNGSEVEVGRFCVRLWVSREGACHRILKALIDAATPEDEALDVVVGHLDLAGF